MSKVSDNKNKVCYIRIPSHQLEILNQILDIDIGKKLSAKKTYLRSIGKNDEEATLKESCYVKFKIVNKSSVR